MAVIEASSGDGVPATAAGDTFKQTPTFMCGIYCKTMMSKIYKGAPYLDFVNFLQSRIGTDLSKDWNFAPTTFDVVRFPRPVVVYKNEKNEIFIDVLYQNTNGLVLTEERHSDVTICKIAYPNCLCDLCLRRHLFSNGGRTEHHVKRMILLGGQVYWVVENERINLKRILMGVEEMNCCQPTYIGFPYWMVPMDRCRFSSMERQKYQLCSFLDLEDGAYFVNPTLTINGPETWARGVVYLVTPTCQKLKVSRIPPVLRDVMITFDDVNGVWVVVIKVVFTLSICIVLFNGFIYQLEEVFIDDDYFV